MKDREQRLVADARLGRGHAHADLRVTPIGLLAVGGLVTMILLGSAVIVRAATRAG